MYVYNTSPNRNKQSWSWLGCKFFKFLLINFSDILVIFLVNSQYYTASKYVFNNFMWIARRQLNKFKKTLKLFLFYKNILKFIK